MNEKKKLFVLLMVVVGIVLFTIIGSVIESNKSTKYLDKFYSDLNGTENKLVLIGRDDCSWCKLYQPVLDFYKEQYNARDRQEASSRGSQYLGGVLL